MATFVTSQLADGLYKIDQSHLPGKFKVWCYQSTLFQCLMWPLKLCDITSTTALKMDAEANSYIQKWLGLPRCLSTTALFGSNTLKLPLKSISLGYRQEKVRLVFELRDCPNPSVQNTKAQVRTGCEWNAAQAVDQAISCETSGDRWFAAVRQSWLWMGNSNQDVVHSH